MTFYVGIFLIALGVFLYFGNVEGFFRTVDYAGFFVGSIGSLVTLYAATRSRHKSVRALTTINDHPVERSGATTAEVELEGRSGVMVEGALYLTRERLYFSSFGGGKVSIDLPIREIAAVRTGRFLGLVPNRAVIAHKSGKELAFILTRADRWVETILRLKDSPEQRAD